MFFIKSIIAGFSGAATLTILHQYLKENTTNAPRMDLLGLQLLEEGIKELEIERPAHLYQKAMLADLAVNTLYYGLGLAASKQKIMRGTCLGLAAGVGAVVLPKHIGLKKEYSSRNDKTRVLTVALYTAGGLAAGIVASLLSRTKK